MHEPIVLTYAVYLALSIALTVWVARTLFKNGRLFLVDVFKGNEGLADSINHLLVVGFYLINLGYISLALKLGYDVATARESIEALSRKVGLVLVVLGVMHFFNLFLFSAIRGWGRGRHCAASATHAPASPVSPTWMPAGPAAPIA
jgi:hypothetical protein